MKVRTGFVSNSSSSSFIAIVPMKIHEKVLSELHPFVTAVVNTIGEEQDVLGQRCFVTGKLITMDYGSLDDVDFEWNDDDDDDDDDEDDESGEYRSEDVIKDPSYAYEMLYLSQARKLGKIFTYSVDL